MNHSQHAGSIHEEHIDKPIYMYTNQQEIKQSRMTTQTGLGLLEMVAAACMRTCWACHILLGVPLVGVFAVGTSSTFYLYKYIISRLTACTCPTMGSCASLPGIGCGWTMFGCPDRPTGLNGLEPMCGGGLAWRQLWYRRQRTLVGS